jgi:hypothetical protein
MNEEIEKRKKLRKIYVTITCFLLKEQSTSDNLLIPKYLSLKWAEYVKVYTATVKTL